MPLWKKILLRSVGFGAGFALMLCAVVGVWAWYTERPKPPKPWNKDAITATYDNVAPHGEKNDLAFHYILQNNTDSDYRLDSEAEAEITAKLRRQKELAEFSANFVSTKYPVFVPARSRVRISLTINYAYPVREKSDATDAEQKQYSIDVAKFVTDQLRNLDGFVLFDAMKRYEIDFPTGWEKGTNETPSVDKK